VKRWPFAVAFALMGGTWALLASRSAAEPTVLRRPLAELPRGLDGWTGEDLPMDDRVLSALSLSDHVMRVYDPPASTPAAAGSADLAGRLRQSAAPVWLYVGYYGSQRTGATYHSPKNCLPGEGWQLHAIEPVAGAIPGSPAATVNRVVVEKGFERELILYWYQDRGRTVASEYAAKGYLVWDAMTRNRTDGALVRVSTPIVGSEEDAYRHALAFVRASWEPITRHLPG
jgi:EpsI family protein